MLPVVVDTWSRETLTGTLAGPPKMIPALREGANVVVQQTDVYDYMLKIPNLPAEGGETDAILEKSRRGGGRQR